MGEGVEIVEDLHIDGEIVRIARTPGLIERLTADDGVYEGEVADILGEEGEKIRTVPHGRGTFRWICGDVFEGEWRLNRQYGKGKFTYVDGGFYQGDWINDEQHGYGELCDVNGEYEGEFEHDERSGKGKQQYRNSDVYTGNWLNDKRHGKGVQKWADGPHYEGDWVNDLMHGVGSYIFKNGDRYDGEFHMDEKTGKGQYTWADSADQLTKYVGGFLHGKRHGEGIERYRNGSWQIGTWQEGDHCGQQILHKPNPCKPDFRFDTISQVSEDIRPHVDDTTWRMLEDANKKGKVLEVSLPAAIEEELRKCQKATQEVIDNTPGTDGYNQRQAETARLKQVEEEEEQKRQQEAALAQQEELTATTSSVSAKRDIDQFLRQHADAKMDEELSGWRLGNLLGQGSYGAVYAGLKRSGGMMAVKCVELGNIQDEEDVNALINEIGVMRGLIHTNIVRYLGASKDPDADMLYIFLEYIPGGSLAAVIKKFGTLDMETARRYTKQICYAISFLHERGIIHRDIKGDNILLTGDGIVKLADFGCSKNLLEIQAKTHGVAAKSMVGTPYWMAPEVITNQDQGYSFRADIWSIGCTVVEMITGKPPWPEFSSMWGAVFHIANSVGPPEGIPQDISLELKAFLDGCFQRDVELRYSADQLIQDTSWMSNC